MKYIVFILAVLSCFLPVHKLLAAIPSQELFVDSDGDGVVDRNDDCYKTPLGVNVGSKGCAIIQVVTKEIVLNINFSLDSAIVEKSYYSEVEKVAQFMRENPLTRVVIEGHSDSDGTDSYNQRLSTKRAQAVAALLVNYFSVAKERVTAIGFGESRPLVPNNTVENKKKNRRVVAVIRKTNEKRG